MNTKIKILLLFLMFNSVIFGQEIASIKKYEIQSKELNQKREFFVYTPAGYNENPYTYYDVIYVFDAQNRELFDLTHSLISFVANDYQNYIVVGITSPYNEKLNYGRRNDFLPKLTNDKYSPSGKFAGNATNFLKYIQNEIIPFVDNHYKTLNNRTVIGHSLGASFVLYSFLNTPDLFNNYIAISPNLAYGNELLVNELYHFEFAKLTTKKYLYISNANEETIEDFKDWKPAREKAYAFLKDTLRSDKLHVEIKEFPDKNHWQSFLPSLEFSLNHFINEIYVKDQISLSKEEYEVTIQVKVPHKNDDIYITGNQINLGNWNPQQIKMNKKSDFVRELKIRLQSPAKFKFTRGNWDSEAIMKNNDSGKDLTIKPKPSGKYTFTIENYLDKLQ
ncbi:MAG: esterase [Bacteroidia bacterium]|nr:esterase [Bacteroidia bacterium]